MGRRSTYSEEIADEICRRLANGEFLRVICREEGMPHWNTVHDWKQANAEFAGRIARAREVGFDAIAEDSMALLEEKPERTSTQFGDKVDSGYVAWQKNRAEQRLKLLAKWDPKRYGDKLAIGGDAENPIKTEQTLDVANLPTEVLAAIMKARDAAKQG